MTYRKILAAFSGVLFAMSAAQASAAGKYDGKKVLFIDSYHEGYAWSDGTLAGVSSVLDSSGAQLEVVRMDTKRKKEEEDKLAAAEMVRSAISQFNPDVVIASDDNASKYVVMPYFKDAALPFVFCGVNWDATVYGYPYKNVTGMIEVSAADELFAFLERLTDGRRIGYLAADVFTAHKEQENIAKTFNMNFAETRYAKDLAEWQVQFRELQRTVDILLVGNAVGTEGWDEEAAARFAESNTRVPTWAIDEHMAPFALIGYTKLPQEQGEWAAKTALKILDGKSPADIAISRNRQGRLILNARIAEGLGEGAMAALGDILQSADQIIE